MDELEVEWIGGMAGFGGPGSRIRSHGTLMLSELRAEDRSRVEALLARKDKTAPQPDEFVYRITRRSVSGKITVEVPESQVPQELRNCVRDELI